ncbi:putative integral membrane protein [Babesia bovis T2Bo]|uniref:t-SNARE coiled-coil homology domain-containing protein n=1 Tax=Babesia bovis TaxID=5865 RepID=A7AP95_BABBO|nr:putative integral membrane protein [Babesia bovis T2Bo]EDO08379.1 putative integral membrane protein [Babesia bovis T2Bo]|eukprot:XP_001611947.1 hypothetical protein [Babesia bovis T2Bo]
MDRSSVYKRRVAHYVRVIGLKPSDDGSVHSAVDRFSVISSNVFIQLQTLHKLVEPYTVYVPLNAPKHLVGGYVETPKCSNVIAFIYNKRRLFGDTNIKDIVHDIRTAGDLIKHLSSGIEAEIKKSQESKVSRHLQEHRIGVIACLQHMLKLVQSYIEEYERYRLKFETTSSLALRIMTENCLKSLKTSVTREEEETTNSIAKEYLQLFMGDHTGKAVDVLHENTSVQTPVAAAGQLPPSEFTGSLTSKSRHSGHSTDSVVATRMEYLETPSDHDVQMLEMQHKALVQRVNESVQAAELSTIDGVQQRLTEISSMFEQFSGTLAVQLDMFECINANVMESLSNIETTETSLKKTESQGMSFMQQMMCYSFMGSALFLLLVDYIRSRSGNYIL